MFPMTSSTTTKATLSSDLEAAEARVIELEARIIELEARIEDLQRVELSTTVWINDRITSDTTRGGDPLVKFSGQKSVKAADSGRVYGQYHNFVAYRDMADTFNQLHAAGEKLVTITAFESPWSNGARRSDWVVTSITPFVRPEAAPASEPGPAENYGDTHGDDIPF